MERRLSAAPNWTSRTHLLRLRAMRQHRLSVVGFRDLFSADPGKTVRDVMRTKFVSATEHMDQETVARLFSQYHLRAMRRPARIYKSSAAWRLMTLLSSNRLLANSQKARRLAYYSLCGRNDRNRDGHIEKEIARAVSVGSVRPADYQQRQLRPLSENARHPGHGRGRSPPP